MGKSNYVSGDEGIYNLSWGVMAAQNLSTGVNHGHYYVVGGCGKFVLHGRCFSI